MQEEQPDASDIESVNSHWLEDTGPATTSPEASRADGMLVGIREKASGKLFAELEELEEKVEALIAHCEQLQRLNEGLTQRLSKESQSHAELLDVHTGARKRVDQLIQRLRDLEEETK